MAQTWSSWKRFPDAQIGDSVEAPIGPGVYEVRHTMTGRLMAFGHAGNVANAIAELKFDGGASTFALTLKLMASEVVVSPCSSGSSRRMGELPTSVATASNVRPG